MCGFTCCCDREGESPWALLKVRSSHLDYLCGHEGAQESGVGSVILAEAAVCPEESHSTSIPLGWWGQAPLISSNFMIRHLAFLLFFYFF